MRIGTRGANTTGAPQVRPLLFCLGNCPMTSSPQTIAVLGGTGAEGSGIALRLAHAGHTVLVGSRDADKAARVCEEL
ncbi:NAD(P)-binding domain-containing protein, partial [Acidovorax delafieldii]